MCDLISWRRLSTIIGQVMQNFYLWFPTIYSSFTDIRMELAKYIPLFYKITCCRAKACSERTTATDQHRDVENTEVLKQRRFIIWSVRKKAVGIFDGVVCIVWGTSSFVVRRNSSGVSAWQLQRLDGRCDIISYYITLPWKTVLLNSLR